MTLSWQNRSLHWPGPVRGEDLRHTLDLWQWDHWQLPGEIWE